MNKIELTAETFLLFAAKNYTNPSCIGIKEFENDAKIIFLILNESDNILGQVGICIDDNSSNNFRTSQNTSSKSSY